MSETLEDDQIVEDTVQPDEDDAGAPEEDTSGDTTVDDDQPADTDDAPPSRRESRTQRLANQLREEREARIRLEARIEEQSRVRTPTIDHNESARLEAEKLSLMDPSEKRAYLQEKEILQLKQGVAQTQYQMKDALDKAHYSGLKSADKTAAKYEAEVEKRYMDALSKGMFVPRETWLNLVVGENLRKEASKPVSKKVQEQKRQAGERVRSVNGTPTSARSDAGGGSGGGKEETLEQLRARILERERTGNTY